MFYNYKNAIFILLPKESWNREPLLKGKAQYTWPPHYIQAHFKHNFLNIILYYLCLHNLLFKYKTAIFILLPNTL